MCVKRNPLATDQDGQHFECRENGGHLDEIHGHQTDATMMTMTPRKVALLAAGDGCLHLHAAPAGIAHGAVATSRTIRMIVRNLTVSIPRTGSITIP